MDQQILFDARWIGNHGIGRFAREVRQRLAGVYADIPGHHPVSLRGLIESETVPRAMYQPGAFYLQPGYTPCLSWKGRSAFTVHDLIHLDIREESSGMKAQYYELVVKRAIRSERITTLTVSEFSRNRIAEWAGVPADRILVTHNGVAPSFTPAGPSKNIGRPYVLHVGNTKPHKNLSRLITALSDIPDILLVCSSRPDPHLLEHARTHRMADRLMFLSGIPEQDLPLWYRGAAVVAIPSLYEGFGLPALEGMACGTPVVASGRTALAEVINDAGVTINPEEVDSIRDGILTALNDTALRDLLVARGLSRARQFSWDEVAKNVNNALNQFSGD